jgi:hypothetical protein
MECTTMEQWEVCYVDLLNHEVTHLSAEGLERKRIKRDKSLEDDSRDDAVARLVANLGMQGWELTNGYGDVRPVLFFRRRLAKVRPGK